MLAKPSRNRAASCFQLLPIACLLCLALGGRWILGAENEKSASESAAAKTEEAHLAEIDKYLSSDELEGRGIGTEGIDKAANYIAEQFKQAGLKTEVFDGQPFQKFTIVTSSKLGVKESNHLAFTEPTKNSEGPPREIDVSLDHDYTPLSIGGSGKFDLPVVFVGYGITAPQYGYDDYAGIDVKGKAVIILRHEPQQDNPHSVFNGTEDSPYAEGSRKIANAYEHGAELVLLVTDDHELRKQAKDTDQAVKKAEEELDQVTKNYQSVDHHSEEEIKIFLQEEARLKTHIAELNRSAHMDFDTLLKFDHFGKTSEGRRMPVVNVRRSAIDPIVKAALGTDLAALEKQIDVGPKPASAVLPNRRVNGEVKIDSVETELKNVVGVLEGTGPEADETIVVGAHYDHLGRGEPGTLDPGSHEIHHGADDNASGAAALVEVARQLAVREKKLPRRVVFIAFSGEERGLYGSARYVRQPLVPLDKTIAMLNMDMVGRLKDDKLIIYGTETADVWNGLIDRLNEKYGFQITRHPEGFGPSDHSSFYAKDIPVLHYFTGTHADYHRPSDTFEKIDVPGMRRVTDMVADTVVALAEADSRPAYKEVKGQSQIAKGGDRPYFGSIPDFSQEQPGYSLMGVSKGGPAERAGVKSGDIIIKLGESRIGNLEDFDSALRKFKAGDRVPVVLKRGAEETTVEVTLEPPR